MTDTAATTQKQFDFNRGAQLRLLDELELATPHARRVKGFLRAVDSAAKGGRSVRVSQAKLASIAAASVATLRRAQSEAIDLGLVDVERSEFESTYSLNWLAILDWNTTNPPLTVSDPPAHRERSPRSPCTNPPLTVSGGFAHRERSLSHALPCNLKSHGFQGGWPLEICEKTLGNAAALETLRQHALDRGWIDHTDALRFHTLAASVRRRAAAGQIESPGGAFTASIKRRGRDERWAWGTPDDEATAAAMLTRARPPAASTLAAEALEIITQAAANATADEERPPFQTDADRLADYRRRLAARFPATR